MKPQNDLVIYFNSYFRAFEERNLIDCVNFFSEDACILFMMNAYRGRQDIQKWHEERFKAGLLILSLKNIKVAENLLCARAKITSKRIRAWPAKHFTILIQATFEKNLIKDLRFELCTIETQ